MIFTYLVSTVVAASGTNPDGSKWSTGEPTGVLPFACTIKTKSASAPTKFQIDLNRSGRKEVQKQGHKIVLEARGRNRYVKLSLDNKSERHLLRKKGFTIKVKKQDTIVKCTLPSE